MAQSIWIVGVICVVQEVCGTLPSLEEVKTRTRWCLGEGAHCPVNLPYFSSCCKPLVCTTIPVTRKHTWWSMLTDYKDHTCLMPSTQPWFYDVQVNTSLPQSQYSNITVEPLLPISDITTEYLKKENTTWTDQLERLKHVINLTRPSIKENLNDNLNHTFSEKNINLIHSKKSNWWNESSSNETNSGKYVTFNSNNPNLGKKKTNSKFIESSSSHIKKSSVSSALSEKSSFNNRSEYSDSGSASSSDCDTNSTDDSQCSTGSSESNFASSSESEVMASSSDSGNKEKTNGMISKHTSIKNKSEDQIGDNLVNNADSSKESTNSSAEIEEDWTSSEMEYDHRPRLYKIVTIHPFRLFQSVETVKLNESIETSD